MISEGIKTSDKAYTAGSLMAKVILNPFVD